VYGCADNTSRTTTIKKETKVDSDGNQKTKIETKTEEQSSTDRNAPPLRDRETTVEVKKSDPVVKVGPLEIK
jgi:hypothetical protein